MEENKVTKYYISNWEKVKPILVLPDSEYVDIMDDELDCFFEHALFDTEVAAIKQFIKNLEGANRIWEDKIKIREKELENIKKEVADNIILMSEQKSLIKSLRNRKSAKRNRSGRRPTKRQHP